jgi:hypothetical protein
MSSRMKQLLLKLLLIAMWPALAVAEEPVLAEEPAPTSTAPVTAAAPSNQRMDLDPTAIRGNQELPKVLYIVPWKDPGLAEPAGRPLNSLVDEALAPVDRDVFRRQMRYFDQLYAGEEAPGAVAPAAPGN